MELARYDQKLPVTTEELHQFVLIGKEQLNAHKAKIRAIEKISSAYAAKDAALSDAQDLADVLLDAEGKLGQMLTVIEPKPVIESSEDGTINKAPLRGREKTLPTGITKKDSHFAQPVFGSDPRGVNGCLSR